MKWSEVPEAVRLLVMVAGFLLAAFLAWWDRRRKLLVRVTWRWVAGHDPGGLIEDYKEVFVRVANPRSKPITVIAIRYALTPPASAPFGGRFRRCELPTTLKESEAVTAEAVIIEWEAVQSLWAEDSTGKRWNATRDDLESVRSALISKSPHQD